MMTSCCGWTHAFKAPNKWSQRTDLHRQPIGYQPIALLVELRRDEMAPGAGLAPATLRLTAGCYY